MEPNFRHTELYKNCLMNLNVCTIGIKVTFKDKWGIHIIKRGVKFLRVFFSVYPKNIKYTLPFVNI